MNEKTKKLLAKWDKVLNHPLAKSLNENKKHIVAMMLENQLDFISRGAEGRRQLNEDMNFGNHVSVTDVNEYDTILIPLLRRVAPDLIALDILGTQPMEKPTQLIFAMRAHYAGNDTVNAFPLPGQNPMGTRLPYDQKANSLPEKQQFYEIVQVVNTDSVTPVANYNVGDIVSNDWSGGLQTKFALILYREVDTNTGRITLLLERLNASKQSHRQVGLMGFSPTPFFTKSDKIVPDVVNPAWPVIPIVYFDLPDEAMYNAVLQNYSGPYDKTVSEQMGKDINQMGFSIDKVTVSARTRILKARYSFEVAEDLKAYHGLDADNELVNILSYEILAEMNREIVDKIRLAAIQAGINPFNYSTVDGRWSQERFRTLYNLINKVSNQIAISTRRGNGNFIICSMDVKTALESLDGYEMWTDINKNFNSNSAIVYAGTIGGRYKVYVDTFATKDYVIVGYKGDSELDAGMFYCPYVPLNMVRAVGQDDFQPRLGFRTRYGLAENPFGAKLYYRYIDVTGLSYAYGDGPVPFYFDNV